MIYWAQCLGQKGSQITVPKIRTMREGIRYEITYSPSSTTTQEGVIIGNPDPLRFTNREIAIKTYDELRDPESDLARELKPDRLSVELFHIYEVRTKMVPSNTP